MLLLASSVCGLFKWRQFEPEVILLAVGWYLRFSLSYREVEELLAERGLWVDHVTVWRWVQRYTPELQRRLRRRLEPTSDSWHSRRNLHTDQGQVALPVSGGGLHRCDPRLSPLGQAGRGRCKALPGQSLGSTEPSRAACHQHRWACGLPARDRSTERVKERWTAAASTGRCRTSIMSWSRTTGPSSGGLTPARVSVLFGPPGARWPAMR